MRSRLYEEIAGNRSALNGKLIARPPRPGFSVRTGITRARSFDPARLDRIRAGCNRDRRRRPSRRRGLVGAHPVRTLSADAVSTHLSKLLVVLSFTSSNPDSRMDDRNDDGLDLRPLRDSWPQVVEILIDLVDDRFSRPDRRGDRRLSGHSTSRADHCIRRNRTLDADPASTLRLCFHERVDVGLDPQDLFLAQHYGRIFTAALS
jgi:hypothetical protein